MSRKSILQLAKMQEIAAWEDLVVLSKELYELSQAFELTGQNVLKEKMDEYSTRIIRSCNTIKSHK
jgi:hypothetical protein